MKKPNQYMPTVPKSKRPPASALKNAFSVHPKDRAKFMAWKGQLFIYKHGLKREPVYFGPVLLMYALEQTRSNHWRFLAGEWFNSTGKFHEFNIPSGVSSKEAMRQLINAGYEGYMDGGAYLHDIVSAVGKITERLSYAEMYGKFFPHVLPCDVGTDQIDYQLPMHAQGKRDISKQVARTQAKLAKLRERFDKRHAELWEIQAQIQDEQKQLLGAML